MIMLVIHSGLSNWRRALAAVAAASILMAVAPSAVLPNAMAQPNASKGAPNALQGFSQNRGQPVQIEAGALEVRDKDKVATFSGNVKVVQGDTTMRCKSLVVFYEQQGQPAGAPAMKAATPGPGGSSQISRLEATGGVTVNQKDQTATGDKALFDMKANTVTLKGNVVVSQGQNVMRGDQLVVNLTTGVSQVIAGPSSQVRVLMQPGGSSQDGKPGSGPGSSQGSNPGLGPRFGPSFGSPKQNSSN
jgi:lipopolysaccharide export system protein LptA